MVGSITYGNTLSMLNLVKKKKKTSPAEQSGMHLNKQIDLYEKELVSSLNQYEPIHKSYNDSKNTKKQKLKTLELKTKLINIELSLLRFEKKKEQLAAKRGVNLLPHEKKTLSYQKMIHFIDTYHDGLKKMEQLKEKIEKTEQIAIDRMI